MAWFEQVVRYFQLCATLEGGSLDGEGGGVTEDVVLRSLADMIYIYGSTTAPGSSAKVLLDAQGARRQGETLGNFIAMRAGVGGDMLPERCVRLALFARLSNSITGCGKLRPATVRAIADLLRTSPQVPLQSGACSGEVMPLSWLMQPLADLPLAIGEATALVNGSPFATAMACDVALTASRRVKLAERIFALSIEASECPAGHFDRRLADRHAEFEASP